MPRGDVAYDTCQTIVMLHAVHAALRHQRRAHVESCFVHAAISTDYD